MTRAGDDAAALLAKRLQKGEGGSARRLPPRLSRVRECTDHGSVMALVVLPLGSVDDRSMDTLSMIATVAFSAVAESGLAQSAEAGRASWR